MEKKTLETPLIAELAVCVTFFFAEERLKYLQQIISKYSDIAAQTTVYIITNVSDTDRIERSLATLPGSIKIQFITPSGLGHPYLLTWAHRDVFRKFVLPGNASHFLYTEDDLLLTRDNVKYWLRNREILSQFGLFPSFFRVEYHKERGWVSSDCRRPTSLFSLPHLRLSNELLYVCMHNPYQGLYFLDRPLMEEFYASPAWSPDFGKWRIRERAAQGLTFVNVPAGYTSRNLVKIEVGSKSVSEECWVHHLPNNYANSSSTYGKIAAGDNSLFDPSPYMRVKQNLRRIKCDFKKALSRS